MRGSVLLQPARVAVALLTALTSYLTFRSWSGISADPGAYLQPLLLVCLVLAGSGLALRAARLPGGAVVATQVVLVLVLLNHLWAAPASVLGWVPTPTSLRASVDVLVQSGIAAQEWRAPVPADVTEFPPLLIGAGALIALVVEVIAGTLRRVPLAGLPLIGAFTMPVSLLGGVPSLTFGWAALSFALLLAADQAVRLGQWGGPATATGPDADDGAEVGLPSVLPSAAGVGAIGVALAVVAPILLPSGLGVLDGLGSGGGGAGDGGPLQLTNPMLNMQRDLEQGADDPLVQVVTDDPDPEYLRLTVLDEFDGEAWRPADRDIPPTNQAAEQLPNPPGLRPSTPRREVQSRMVATDAFESQWLPTPYPAVDVAVEGDWRYDSETLDIVGSETEFSQAEVTSLDVDPSAEQLVGAGVAPASVLRVGTDLPDDMPDFIEETAQRVTEGAGSDFERAVMMQRWFTDPANFEYTLDTGEGNGLEQIELFLSDEPGGRRGYCEQFASAMALMARSLGMPARISVGFLTPDPSGPQQFVYSRRDLHAWPEIYFEGVGWTLFEPTPGQRGTDAPGYTTGELPSEQESAGPTDTPSASASAPQRELRRDDVLPEFSETATDEGNGPWLPIGGGVVLLVVLALTPRALRELARRRRLGGPDAVEGAWSEVRATALDLDLDWDDGATLRRQAIGLLGPLRRRVPDEADDPRRDARVAADLEALVVALERGRYSRQGLDPADRAAAVDQAERVGTALREAADPGVRRRATWLPSSLWRARRVNAAPASGDPAEREQMLL